VGGNVSNSIYGDYANGDWGVYNKISNGGNKAGKWRTLTYDEWNYLIGDNTQRSGKYAFATIDVRFKGFVLLPDDWTLPSGVTFTAGYDNGFTTNTYTMAQWQKMEAAGAVFLPAAGNRDGTSVEGVGTNGYYFSSSRYNGGYVYGLDFSNDEMNVGLIFRAFGCSVRLVRD
jgi:hypothetical protein